MSPLKYLILALAVCSAAWAESPFVGGAWVGNVTSSTVTVSIRLGAASQKARLQVSTTPALAPAVYSSTVTSAATSGNTVKLSVQGLQADTEYFYGVEVAGVLRTEAESRGRFRTFPLGRGSFRIVFAGDSDFRIEDQRAFDAILADRPALFIHLGDLHYIDTNTTNADDYRANYDSVLKHPRQAPVFRNMPTVYTWGDHDFCGDNSNGTFAGRDTARTIYRERVPHYPIGSAGGALAQAFTIGRVRIIVTDTRSASVAASAKESSSKTRLGSTQKAWLKQELINARDSGFPLILWASADPWIAPAALGEDSWGGYATERTEIANFIRDNRITNLVLLSADMHALAYDNGTNSDYATGGGAPLTVLHAAALSQVGSSKGGPYTAGPLPGTNQFGVLEVYDNGGPSVACRFLGIRAGEGAKMTHIFSSSAAGAREHALMNISTLARINGSGDSLVSGFVISSTGDRSVLVRAVGPTLASFGVADALPQPRLSIYRGDQLIAANAGWAKAGRDADELSEAFDRAGAFRLGDESSADAALLLTLSPGAYTAQITSADGRSGTAMLEVYDLP